MEDTKPKVFVFVLMPFSNDFDDVYKVGIKPACKDAGAYCERVDEQIFAENILERVYNQIAKADVIVAEMTGRNPNVFYEVGYAHALNKQVILLTKNVDDIPFDLKHYPHIVYAGSIATLKDQLEARVRWCIQNPKDSLSSADTNLEFFVNGVSIMAAPTIALPFLNGNAPHYTLQIATHNLSKTPVEPKNSSIALVMPGIFDDAQLSPYSNGEGTSIIRFSNGDIICNLRSDETILPDAWNSMTFKIGFYYVFGRKVPLLFNLTLRLFTEVGSRSYPFVLRIPTEQHEG